MQFQPYSQFDLRWRDRYFPNADKSITKPYRLTWGNWGCNGTCICMLVGKDPNQLMDENPDGWQPDGNAYTDKILARYGWKLTGRINVDPNKPLPSRTEPVIAVTNFYASQGQPTHFFLLLPNDQIMDPAPRTKLGETVGPKANKYSGTIVQIRPFERTSAITKKCKCPTCGNLH